MEEYRLVCELYAHEGPVRALCLGPAGELVSGCQANSPNVRRWFVAQNEESRVPELTEVGSAIPHDHWVTAVTHLPSGNTSYPDGCIVTGCFDTKIRIFSSNGELILVLEGHTKGVISFSWTSTGNELISGSWDGTAKIWDLAAGGVCVATLDKHENGVNVLGLANGQIITTSTGESVNNKPANFFIRYWDANTGKQLGPSIKDHELSIKSIAPLVGIGGYATSSNDGTVRVRLTERSDSGEANTLGVLIHPMDDDGTPSFVHHCTPLLTSALCDLVSCSENGSVCVWNSEQKLQQVLPHPTAVWCALSLPGTDGDFVTGGNDGIIRMFSKRPALTSTMASIQLHEALLAAVQDLQDKRRRGPTAEEIAKCPKWEQRGQRVGKKEGDVCLFNKNGEQIAALWSEVSATWIEVGAVTGSGNGGVINGVYYDNVMPVEMETPSHGVQTLQLGYNTGENPFVAAKRFIDENQLQPQYLQQIADWILARGGKDSTPTLGAETHAVGGSSSSSSSSNGGNGASAAGSGAGAVFSFTTQAYFVHDDVPAAAAVQKVMNKIRELNETVGAAAALAPAELDAMESLLGVLATTNQYHVSSVTNGQISALSKSAQWDAAAAFPAFDVARMVALHPSGSQALARHSEASTLFARACLVSMAQPSVLPVVLTSLRLLGNSFRHDDLRQRLLQEGDGKRLAELFSTAARSDLASSRVPNSKLHRVALVNVAFNLAVHFSFISTRKPESVTILADSGILSSCNELLRVILCAETESADLVLRAMQALGMICSSFKSMGGALAPGSALGLSAAVVTAAGKWVGNDAVSKCSGEIIHLLDA